MNFSKEEIERVLEDVENTPGAYSIAEFESKENRAFDKGWQAAIDAVRNVLNNRDLLSILGVSNE